MKTILHGKVIINKYLITHYRDKIKQAYFTEKIFVLLWINFIGDIKFSIPEWKDTSETETIDRQ